MALNSCMLTTSHPARPVPLPSEKVFTNIPFVAADMVALSDSTTPKAGAKPIATANGTVYVSNKRIIYVADDQADPASEIKSLSVNLEKFQDGRFVQPWFAANYYEAVVLPQSGGGFSTLQQLKLHFKQGRGFEFYESIEEVKRRFEEEGGRASAREEALPLYEPPPVVASSSSSGAVGNTTSSTQPSNDDITAANTAQQAEAVEQTEEDGSLVARSTADSDRGLPPSYEDLTAR